MKRLARAWCWTGSIEPEYYILVIETGSARLYVDEGGRLDVVASSNVAPWGHGDRELLWTQR